MSYGPMASGRQAKNIPSRNVFQVVQGPKQHSSFWWQSSLTDWTRRNITDRLELIRDVFESWVATLSRSFIPYENLTIDEKLVGFRGQSSLWQHTKSKPTMYGMKLWALPVPDFTTRIALNMLLYIGKGECETPENNRGERLVRDMIEVITRSGRNVTLDNFLLQCLWRDTCWVTC